ncbi:hypothetical protein [Gemmiger formicilis]|uniref:hypothetical protein n=1 Tax=Gemmiger formicilis TaxID=745368 RepID=UPI00195B7839|nr:hypothetical protein [Gemmiger formicilis]
MQIASRSHPLRARISACIIAHLPGGKKRQNPQKKRLQTGGRQHPAPKPLKKCQLPLALDPVYAYNKSIAIGDTAPRRQVNRKNAEILQQNGSRGDFYHGFGQKDHRR